MWINGPLGVGAERRRTRGGLRMVLVLVPHLVAGTRLVDLLPLLEADHRIQAVFTVPQTLASWAGTEEFVRAQEGLYLPWDQVVHHEFDLVLAASFHEIDSVRGPVFVVPHGAGALKSRLRSRKIGATAVSTRGHGLAREELIRNGKVVTSALVLTHDRELDVLQRECPEAVPHAVVAGDLCLDRLQASLPYREHYRHALGVGNQQKLIIISSTWSEESLFGDRFSLYRRLLDELPTHRFRVAAVLHPNIWQVHGYRQVRAWLSGSTNQGMMLLPPETGWQAAMVAADAIVGDHGSTTTYGAALGVPTVLATFPDNNIRPSSPAAILARTAPRLHDNHALLQQVQALTEDTTAAVNTARALTESLTSRPGLAAEILRHSMYQLLRLPQPAHAVPVAPASLPRPLCNTAISSYGMSTV